MLIAQVAGAAATGGPPEELFLVLLLVGVGLTFVVWLAFRILFLITLSRALAECSPRNRRMEPSQVYWNLVPGFRFAWQFITVGHVTMSLRDEFADRGLPRQGDYGHGLGTTFAVLSVCGLVPYIGVLSRIAAFVVGIVYWINIHGLLRTLRESESYGDGEDAEYRDRYYDDEDDGYRRRRRSRYDDDDDDDDDGRHRRRRSRYDD